MALQIKRQKSLPARSAGGLFLPSAAHARCMCFSEPYVEWRINMTINPLCPLCKGNAGSQILQKIDGAQIDCSTCGTFNVTYEVTTPDVETHAENRIHLLSGVTRRAWDSGHLITITIENISDLVRSVSVPSSPLENMNFALIYVSEKQSKADEETQVFYQNDYPLVLRRTLTNSNSS